MNVLNELQNLNTITVVCLVAFGVAQMIVGTAVGWLLRSRNRKKHVPDLHAQRVHEAVEQLNVLASEIGGVLNEHREQMSTIRGDLDHDLDALVPEVREQVTANVSAMLESNRQLQNQLEAAEEKLQRQREVVGQHLLEARIDALTGLNTRAAFNEQLDQMVADRKGTGAPVSLMFIDVDHFQEFNENHGQCAGDEVLRGVARVLYDSMRDMDVVARYDGETFSVALPDTELSEAEAAAERAREAVAGSEFEVGGERFRITITGGVAEAMPNENPDSLLRRADVALGHAKSAGSNRAHTHNGESCLPVSGRRASGTGAPAPRMVDAELQYRNKTEAVSITDIGARTDDLTGLPNYRAFSEELRRRVAEWHRFQTPVSLMVVDIDRLGLVNKKHGNHIGDIVVRAVTQFLTTAMRETDFVARREGNRFALILPGTDAVNGLRAAERIRSAIALCKLRVDGVELNFTVSAGVAQAEDGETYDTLLSRTDAALAGSKQCGGNCSHLHDAGAILAINEVFLLVNG